MRVSSKRNNRTRTAETEPLANRERDHFCAVRFARVLNLIPHPVEQSVSAGRMADDFCVVNSAANRYRQSPKTSRENARLL